MSASAAQCPSSARATRRYWRSGELKTRHLQLLSSWAMDLRSRKPVVRRLVCVRWCRWLPLQIDHCGAACDPMMKAGTTQLHLSPVERDDLQDDSHGN